MNQNFNSFSNVPAPGTATVESLASSSTATIYNPVTSEEELQSFQIYTNLPKLIYKKVVSLNSKSKPNNLIYQHGCWSHLANDCPWFLLRFVMTAYNFFPYPLNTPRFKVSNGIILWPHFKFACYSSFTYTNEMYVYQNFEEVIKIIFHSDRIEFYEKQ